MDNKRQGPVRKASAVLLAALLSVSCSPAYLAFADEPVANDPPAAVNGGEASGGLSGAGDQTQSDEQADVSAPADANDPASASDPVGTDIPASVEAAPQAVESAPRVGEEAQLAAEDGVIAEGALTTYGGTYKLEKVNGETILTFSSEGACSPGQDKSQEWLVPLNELPAGNIKVILEEGMTSIGQYVFGKGPNPSYVGWTKEHPIDLVLPSTLTSLGRLGIPSDLPIASLTATGGDCPVLGDGFLFEDASKTRILKSDIASGDIVIPEGVKEVASGAFSGVTYGTLSVPASLTSLTSYSFAMAAAADVFFDAIVADPANTKFYVEDDAASNNYGSLCNKSDGSLVLRAAMPGTVTDASGVAYTADYTKLVSAPSSLEGSYTVHQDCEIVLMGAFNGCSLLETLDLANVETVAGGYSTKGSSTFFECTSLREVNAPSVTSIEQYAFMGIESLSSVSLPAATDIATSAFEGCTALADVALPEATAIGRNAFKGSGLQTVSFPKAVSIGSGAFSGSALEAVVLPATVTTLGSSSFSSCARLVSADIAATGLTSLPTAFADCPSLAELKLPAGLTTIAAGALANCTGLESLDLRAFPISTIGATRNTSQGAFEGCTSLVDVKLPDTLATLGTASFSGCTSLASCNLGNLGITTVYANTFANCSSLTDIELPDTLTTLGSAFSGCSSLVSIAVPEGITSLAGTFSNCSSLTSVDLPSTLTKLDSSAFAGCTSLADISLPDGLTLIGTSVFARCAALDSIDIPDSVTDIGSGAFAGSGIADLVMPAGLYTSVQAGQFTSEPIFGSTAVGRTASLFISSFSEGDAGYTNGTIRSVDLSSYQQTFLPTFMFAGATSLESISIPKSVNSIMGGAFMNCTALEDVYYYGDPAVISIFETQKVTHSFGYDYIGAGAFSVPNGTSPEISGPDFAPMEGLTFYGLGITENNALKEYAEKTASDYIPFAFLGGGGTSDEAVAKFGYANPDNTVSVECIESGGTPEFKIGYPFDEGMSRTLVPGEGCSVTYTLDGKDASDLYTPGTYTATITGDGKSVWGTTTATFTVTASDVAMKRHGGAHRYETMALVSGEAFPDNGSCSTVVIARGDNFPDALAAAGLAGVEGGQVLLTETSVLTDETRAEIERLGATRAYVIGDEYSVTTRTFNEIRSLVGGDAERLGGDTRLETAVDIYGAGKGSWGTTAIVATGSKAADSLSVSAIAYALKAPIFLADSDGSLPQSALDAIGQGGFTNVLVLGDGYSVSNATFDKVRALTGAAERIGGTDRYDTSLRIGRWALANGFTCEKVSVTAGREGKFADALVASSLGGRAKSVLLLVDEGGTACIDELLVDNKGRIGSVHVLGDAYTVSDALYQAIKAAVS